MKGEEKIIDYRGNIEVILLKRKNIRRKKDLIGVMQLNSIRPALGEDQAGLTGLGPALQTINHPTNYVPPSLVLPWVLHNILQETYLLI